MDDAVIADTLFDGSHAESKVEDCLMDMLGEEAFGRISWDHYDRSLEIHEVGNDVRLTPDQQRVMLGWGFGKVYVNHHDGWETHYHWDLKREPVRGWRRRYVKDPNATTTNVIAGPSNPGYYEISYWPESWGADMQKDLETGYMRIVPDPLTTGTRLAADGASPVMK